MADRFALLKEKVLEQTSTLKTVFGGFFDRKMGVEKEIQSTMGICHINRLKAKLEELFVNYSGEAQELVNNWKQIGNIDYVIYLIADSKLVLLTHARKLNNSNLWLVQNLGVAKQKGPDKSRGDADKSNDPDGDVDKQKGPDGDVGDVDKQKGGGYTSKRKTRRRKTTKKRVTRRRKTRRSTRKKITASYLT